VDRFVRIHRENNKKTVSVKNPKGQKKRMMKRVSAERRVEEGMSLVKGPETGGRERDRGRTWKGVPLTSETSNPGNPFPQKYGLGKKLGRKLAGRERGSREGTSPFNTVQRAPLEEGGGRQPQPREG